MHSTRSLLAALVFGALAFGCESSHRDTRASSQTGVSPGEYGMQSAGSDMDYARYDSRYQDQRDDARYRSDAEYRRQWDARYPRDEHRYQHDAAYHRMWNETHGIDSRTWEASRQP